MKESVFWATMGMLGTGTAHPPKRSGKTMILHGFHQIVKTYIFENKGA
jgi:hypothetical protein